MADTITTARLDEMREWLRLLHKNWPTALAHTMAIANPDTEIQFSTVEYRLQDMLPLDLMEPVREAAAADMREDQAGNCS